MATVYERVNKLGLAYSPAVLQYLGEAVKKWHCQISLGKVLQREGNEEYWVNVYGDSRALDQFILRIISGKRSSFDREWWEEYKDKQFLQRQHEQSNLSTESRTA